MSVLGDNTGQVWFLTGTCVFVASAISVTVLPFFVLRNANADRGEMDQGTASRLDALQAMSVFYMLGGAFGTITALVIRLMPSASPATWSIAGLPYLLLAGLATIFLVKVAKQIAIKEEQTLHAPVQASMPTNVTTSSGFVAAQDINTAGCVISRPDHGNTAKAEAANPARATRVGFVFNYVAIVMVVIIAVILMGVI